MAWIYLLIAGALEVTWAVALKYAAGFTRLWPSVVSIGGMVLSVLFLSLALRTIPLGTGYAIWTGIGAVGTAIYGMAFLGESATTLRLLCLLLIVSGMVGLKLSL